MNKPKTYERSDQSEKKEKVETKTLWRSLVNSNISRTEIKYYMDKVQNISKKYKVKVQSKILPII